MKRITALAACALCLWACGDGDTKDAPVPEPGAPEASLAAGEASAFSLIFTLTTENAFSAAWLCLPASEPVPDALGIFSRGTAAEPGSAACTASGLEPGSAYRIAAAAARGGEYSRVAVLEMSTSAGGPSVSVQAVSAAAESLRFSLSASGAEKAAWVCLPEGTPGLDVARFILKEGAEAPAGGTQELTAEGLEPMTDYVIAAVAVSGELVSEVSSVRMTTLGNTPEYLYEALQGRWTATLPVLVEAGGAETVDFSFPVEITAGVNDYTTELYRARNRLCCIGFLDIPLYYPDDLLAMEGGYWQSHPDDAQLDWGPKWFLEIAEDNTLSIPAAFYEMTSNHDSSWSLRYDTDKFEFLTGATDKTAFIYLGLPQVSVSDDLNAITVHQWDQTNNSGETFRVYPSAVYVDGSGKLSFRKDCRTGDKFCTGIGAGDLTLTRDGAPASALPPRPAPRAARPSAAHSFGNPVE